MMKPSAGTDGFFAAAAAAERETDARLINPNSFFLGAGASRGADLVAGTSAPTTQQLLPTPLQLQATGASGALNPSPFPHQPFTQHHPRQTQTNPNHYAQQQPLPVSASSSRGAYPPRSEQRATLFSPSDLAEDPSLGISKRQQQQQQRQTLPPYLYVNSNDPSSLGGQQPSTVPLRASPSPLSPRAAAHHLHNRRQESSHPDVQYHQYPAGPPLVPCGSFLMLAPSTRQQQPQSASIPSPHHETTTAPQSSSSASSVEHHNRMAGPNEPCMWLYEGDAYNDPAAPAPTHCQYHHAHNGVQPSAYSLNEANREASQGPPLPGPGGVVFTHSNPHHPHTEGFMNAGTPCAAPPLPNLDPRAVASSTNSPPPHTENHNNHPYAFFASSSAAPSPVSHQWAPPQQDGAPLPPCIQQQQQQCFLPAPPSRRVSACAPPRDAVPSNAANGVRNDDYTTDNTPLSSSAMLQYRTSDQPIESMRPYGQGPVSDARRTDEWEYSNEGEGRDANQADGSQTDNASNSPRSRGSPADHNNNEKQQPISDYERHYNKQTVGSSNQHIIKVRAVISGWKAGTIIGRQGVVINNLRASSGCKITISDDPQSPDRLLSISGTQANVAEVLRRVCMLIGASASSYHAGRGGDRSSKDGVTTSENTVNNNRSTTSPSSTPSVEEVRSGGSSHHTPSENEEEGDSPTSENQQPLNSPFSAPINFTLAVSSPLCGCLIGKAGCQIRVFRQTYGVSFSVSSQTISETMERPVHISGPAENVAKCLAEVCRLFANSPAAAAAAAAWGSGQQLHSSSAGQNSVGQPGGSGPALKDGGYSASMRSGQQSRNNEGTVTVPERGHFRANWRRNVSDAEVYHHRSFPSGVSDVDANSGDGGGEGDAGSRKHTQGGGKGGAKGERRNPQANQRNNARSNMGRCSEEFINDETASGTSNLLGGSPVGECTYELNSGETEVHLLVPNDIVGCIIGKGGKTISEIREVSGAMIAIAESTSRLSPSNSNLDNSRSASATASATSSSSTAVGASSSNTQGTSAAGRFGQAGKTARSRNRVIYIRGHFKNVATARYLMGSSILSAQRGGGSHGGEGFGGAGGSCSS